MAEKDLDADDEGVSRALCAFLWSVEACNSPMLYEQKTKRR
ncbi:MAG: hypothetical protein VST71_10805 [Nitrospirota bacterium]|nr:hypothetical protein [Nitrospirota bacterium]